jgi:hypothetical protein
LETKRNIPKLFRVHFSDSLKVRFATKRSLKAELSDDTRVGDLALVAEASSSVGSCYLAQGRKQRRARVKQSEKQLAKNSHVSLAERATQCNLDIQDSEFSTVKGVAFRA